ncbi:MAG: carbohydrate-binding family 9-like protein [Pyrinomonadaceae bacterium]
MRHENTGGARASCAPRFILHLATCATCALLVAASGARGGSGARAESGVVSGAVSGAVAARAGIGEGSWSGAAQAVAPQNQMKASESTEIEARRAGADFAVGDFDNPAWRRARAVRIEHYWSGERAPEGRRAEARLLWTDAALYVRFVARQTEPLIVSDQPRLGEKTLGLWDRDVCELFVAPDAGAPERYFEFEVAPTGEWLDARIHQLPDKRESDFEYHSGATFAARASGDTITLVMRVPWSALGGAPRAGARWRANLYRCIGKDPTRGYLAWQPTLTPEPSFHVPAKFGWLRFTN